MAVDNELLAKLQETLAITDDIKSCNDEIQTILIETSNSVTTLSNSGSFTSLASDAAVTEYNRLKSKFDEFYNEIDNFRAGISKQIEETYGEDKKSAATISGN